MRVDDELSRALRRFAPLYLVTHFNHAKEITPEAREACERLVDHGIPVENQAVLMRRAKSLTIAPTDPSHSSASTGGPAYYFHPMGVAGGPVTTSPPPRRAGPSSC